MREVEIKIFRDQLGTSLANGFPGLDVTLADETDTEAPILCRNASIACDLVILQEVEVKREGQRKVGLIAVVKGMRKDTLQPSAAYAHTSLLGDTITCNYPMTPEFFARCRLTQRGQLAQRLAEHHALYHVQRHRLRP